MKAVVAEEFGGEWRVTEVPDPIPGPRDLVIAVEASGVCYTDVQQLTNPAYSGTFPRIPGHQPVGKIVSCGELVTEWSPGQRVGVAYAQRWCGHCAYCIEGRYEHCSSISQTGISVDGGHAELLLVDAASVEALPDGIDAAEIAPVFCAGFTVYSGICDAELSPGERCAVVGVGGLGHLALQYAAALGAEVIAVTRSPDKKAELLRLGAHEVVVTGGAKVGETLARAGGVDVILHTANDASRDLLSGLRNYGRLILMGVSHAELPITPVEMIFRKLKVVGSSQGPRSRLREAIALHVRSGARTLVERYPLDGAIEAYQSVAQGTARLRAVLIP